MAFVCGVRRAVRRHLLTIYRAVQMARVSWLVTQVASAGLLSVHNAVAEYGMHFMLARPRLRRMGHLKDPPPLPRRPARRAAGSAWSQLSESQLGTEEFVRVRPRESMPPPASLALDKRRRRSFCSL